MVVLEGEAGDGKQQTNEEPDKEEVKQPSLLSLESILLQNDFGILLGCNIYIFDLFMNFLTRNLFNFNQYNLCCSHNDVNRNAFIKQSENISVKVLMSHR